MSASPNLIAASNQAGDEDEISEAPLVTVKSSQKIFTDAEVSSLTGICVDHLHNFARSRLMVLVTLFPRCTH
jgi:hypothetical protein